MLQLIFALLSRYSCLSLEDRRQYCILLMHLKDDKITAISTAKKAAI